MVSSFQVLEHIADVRSFIQGKIKCLKNNGYLVVSVPNNDSNFLRYQQGAVLNMPPHHMGLWNEKALRKIAKVFELELVEVLIEPLQKYHYLHYFTGYLTTNFGHFFSRVMMKIITIFRLTQLVEKTIDKRAAKIAGHTIMVVFKKNDFIALKSAMAK